MKVPFKNREDGSTLFVAMTICLIVGLILSGYLVLTKNRFQMTVRSSDWNAAMPILEAGVEEAMTHMTRDTNAPTANNWALTNIAGNQVYAKKRTFSDGSYFYVYIRDFNSNSPTIYSQGFVRSPYHANKYIARLVKVGVTNPPTVYTHAISANGQIGLVGNALVDGFDSRLGSYNTSSNRSALGGLATNAKTVGAISTGGANVYGPVSTGPGGTVSTGSGSIGDVAWNASHSGIEPGWTNNTMNVAFPSNSPPTGGPFLAPTSSALTNLASGTYQMSSYSGNMTVVGNVTLYVTGGVNMSGSDTITIKPGGSLKMIVGGTVSVGGGGVMNSPGLAANFTIIGLTSCTSITYSGSAQFIGTINAPQADFTLKGTADAFGAIIANSASMNGNTAFHYDASLAFQDGYLVNNWQEL
jgi:hypothetical protein